MKIRIASISDVKIINSIIIQANTPIALKYNIDSDNGKSHPSNCKESWIIENINNSVYYFICYIDQNPVGVVASKLKLETITMKHLAVLPDFWGKGIGTQLVFHIIKYGKTLGAKSINLGVISCNLKLQDWYNHLGFTLYRSKNIKGLPYKVSFMKMSL